MGPSSCHAGRCILAGLGGGFAARGGLSGWGRPVQLGAGLWLAIACRGGATCRGGAARPAWSGLVVCDSLLGWGGGPFSLEWACGPQWLAGLAAACRAGGGRAATSSIGRVRAARTVRRGVVRNAALWQRRLLSWEQRTKFRELSCSVREASSTRFVCCTTG